MTGMAIDLSLEPFWVPDLHLTSQEHPPKSGRVPDFFQKNVITFLNFSRCFGGSGNFFSSFFFGTIFDKNDLKFRNFYS